MNLLGSEGTHAPVRKCSALHITNLYIAEHLLCNFLLPASIA